MIYIHFSELLALLFLFTKEVEHVFPICLLTHLYAFCDCIFIMFAVFLKK